MTDRAKFIADCLQRVDQVEVTTGTAKHQKMATSPFVFYRGSAPLMYADIKAGNFELPLPLLELPLTTVMGDCHTSNFGFLTEEGSHGDNVIFSPNDFDDACVGHASWDLARFITSLFLVVYHCQLVKSGVISHEKDYSEKPVIDLSQAHQAAKEFIDSYTQTCQQGIDDSESRRQALENFPEYHILYKALSKAKRRSASGDDFLHKSALAKAIDLTHTEFKFVERSDKYQKLDDALYQELQTVFSPYVDDTIHDIVLRLNAGTGSVNMDRYYLLVGPKHDSLNQLSLCHIVEVKQQRHAAPLESFGELSPINQLNPAHLTVNCQRRMQRSPDLVLDEVMWRGHHWLVRSRHHAKVGIDPEQIGLGKKAAEKDGLIAYAAACGKALALAHCRGDRRSTLFEQGVVKLLPQNTAALVDSCYQYAEQVVEDAKILKTLLPS